MTELAEGEVGDQTIMDIAGHHVSKQMLKHHSRIRMKAKPEALELVVRPTSASTSEVMNNRNAIHYA
jgi:uncharacterized hydantoinase/oxoprolinase family protein